MNRSTLRVAIAFALITTAFSLEACNQAPKLDVTRLPEVQPDLPQVPQIPPPPAAYPDGSVPIGRLRRRLVEYLDKDIEVTGYIVAIYQPPECVTRGGCPRPLQPHLFIADAANEGDEGKRLEVVGYAASQEELETFIRAGTRIPPNMDGTPRPPIDFAVGNKVKFRGHFATSAQGVSATNGLLEYRGHETLEAAAAPQ